MSADWQTCCAYFGVSPSRRKYTVKCPVHHDRTPSLEIKQRDDGSVWVKCWSQDCDFREVRNRIGLVFAPSARETAYHPDSYRIPSPRTRTPVVPAVVEGADLPSPPDQPPGGEPLCAATASFRHQRHLAPVVEYPVRALDGTTLGTVVRYTNSDTGKKEFRPFTIDGTSTMTDEMKDLVYHLPELREAIARGAVVAVSEGQKDCDALARVGIVAACNANGAGAWRPALAQHFAGAGEVLVFSDREASGVGQRWADDVCASLVALLPPPRVRRVELPPVLGGFRIKDVSDYLAAGGTREMLAERIAAGPLLASGPPPRERPRRLRQWLEDPNILKPPAVVIPFLAWAGRVSLFSAREKIGKSTLTGQAVAAATRGGTFLGEVVPACDVLWYGIDEPIGDAVRRLQENGADVDRTILQDVRPESAADLRSDLERFPDVRLVVIDTLTELASGQLESDKDAQQVAMFVRPYVEVARQTGVALLLIHHTTKAGREFRGSVQLGAAVDVKVQLRQPERAIPEGEVDDEPTTDDGIRLLDAKGRGVTFGVRLQFDPGRYRLADTPPSMRNRVLDGVTMYGPISGSALAKEIGGKKERVLSALHALRVEGLCWAPDSDKGKWSLTPVGRRNAASGSASDVLAQTAGNRSLSPVGDTAVVGSLAESHDTGAGTGVVASDATSEGFAHGIAGGATGSSSGAATSPAPASPAVFSSPDWYADDEELAAHLGEHALVGQ